MSEIQNYLNSLQGISYKEWVKIKIAIDRSFDKKIGELGNDVQLTDTEEIKRIIQSQFG